MKKKTKYVIIGQRSGEFQEGDFSGAL